MINGMLTIKEFAEMHGKSVQAVYQQIKSKENAKALEGHIVIHRVGNKDTKLLDEEAVRILQSASMQAPQVIMQTDDKERIEQLRQEKENLLLKIAAQADEIAAFAKWKAEQATTLALAEQTRLQLQAAEEDKKALADSRDEYKAEADEQHRRAEQAERRAEGLQEQLEAEQRRKLTAWERLTGKKKV